MICSSCRQCPGHRALRPQAAGRCSAPLLASCTPSSSGVRAAATAGPRARAANASAHTRTHARVRRRHVGLLPASALTPAGAELALARASARQGKPRPHARPRRPEGWLHEVGASELRPPPPPDGSSVPAAVGRGARPQFRRGAANLGVRELDPLGPTTGEHPPPAS